MVRRLIAPTRGPSKDSKGPSVSMMYTKKSNDFVSFRFVSFRFVSLGLMPVSDLL
jgi:hypothetical protein